MAVCMEARTEELVIALRRAKEAYVAALNEAYRVGIPVQTLRSAGLVGRDLD
jgi:hypothetical protein